MNKFIVAFLTLAGGILLVGIMSAPSNVFFAPTPSYKTENPTTGGGPKSETLSDFNTIQPNTSGYPQNLTQNFAKSLAKKFVEINRKGPKSIQGKLSLTVPDANALQSAVQQTVASLTPEAIGLSAAMDDRAITFGDDTSRMGAIAYLHVVSEIIANGGGELAKPATAQTSPDFNAQNSALQGEIAAIEHTAVPPALVEFHRALLLTLTHMSEITTIVMNEKADPLKAWGMSKNGNLFLQHDIKSTRDAFNHIHWNALSIAPTQTFSLFSFLPLIQQAHAQAYVPVKDQEAIDALNKILDTLNNTFDLLKGEWALIEETTQIKYETTNQLQQDVLSWVRGSAGTEDALFITNWNQFLAAAGANGAAVAIDDFSQGICSDYKDLITQSLIATDVNIPPYPSCTLPDNQRNILNDGSQGGCKYVSGLQSTGGPQGGGFTLGGPGYFDCSESQEWWQAYAQMLQPQNNIWGALATYTDIADQNQQIAAQEANTIGTASQGFQPTAVCLEQTASGLCRNYEITTPGITISAAFDSAMDSAIKEIADSQFIPDCVNQIWTESFLSKIISSGGNGITEGNVLSIPSACHITSHPI